MTETLKRNSNVLRSAYINGYTLPPITYEKDLSIQQTKWLRDLVLEALEEMEHETTK
jgi:hypothetical protein